MSEVINMDSVEKVTGGSSSQHGTLVIVNVHECCNVRSRPGTDYPKIGHAYLGEQFSFSGKTGAWYKVNFHGKTGYIHQDYTAIVIK